MAGRHAARRRVLTPVRLLVAATLVAVAALVVVVGPFGRSDAPAPSVPTVPGTSTPGAFTSPATRVTSRSTT